MLGVELSSLLLHSESCYGNETVHVFAVRGFRIERVCGNVPNLLKWKLKLGSEPRSLPLKCIPLS